MDFINYDVGNYVAMYRLSNVDWLILKRVLEGAYQGRFSETALQRIAEIVAAVQQTENKNGDVLVRQTVSFPYFSVYAIANFIKIFFTFAMASAGAWSGLFCRPLRS